MFVSNSEELFNLLYGRIESRILEITDAIELEWVKTPLKYHIEIGGKRLRPIFTLLTSAMISNEYENSLDSAVAVELLHNFTLIHDDIMDNSPLRRNQTTVFKKWDETRAILLGDIMIGYAYKLLPANPKIYEQFTTALIDVCKGQVLDIEFNERKDINVNDYLKMIDLKTSRLIEASALIGALNYDANEKQIKQINEFGNYIGLAFQLQDDLLDLTANSAELGKVIGQDIVEGKKTFLIIRGLEKTKVLSERTILNDLLENNGLPIEKVGEVRKLLEELGIIKETKELINDYYKKAVGSLNIFEENEYKKCLIWIIEKLKNRNN